MIDREVVTGTGIGGKLITFPMIQMLQITFEVLYFRKHKGGLRR